MLSIQTMSIKKLNWSNLFHLCEHAYSAIASCFQLLADNQVLDYQKPLEFGSGEVGMTCLNS